MVFDVTSADIDSSLQLAFEHHSNGRLDQATQLYQQVLALAPDHGDALHLLGLAQHQSGDSIGAVASLRHAVAVAPQQPIFLTNLAAVCSAVGDHQDAVVSLVAAARLAPTDPAIREALGSALTNVGRHQEAKAQLMTAVDLGGGPLAHASLANIFSLHGDYENAVTHYRTAIAQGLTEPLILVAFGQCLDALGFWEEAATALEQAAQADPTEIDALVLAARIYGDHERYDDAVCAWLSVVARGGETPVALDGLGSAYWRRGAFNAAIDTYYDALALDPNRVDTLNNASLVLLDAGRGEEAERHSRRAILINPALSQPYVNLSDALSLRGARREAAEALLQAQRIMAADLTAFDHSPEMTQIEGPSPAVLRDRLRRLKALDQIGAALIDHCAEMGRNNDLVKIFHWRISLLRDRVATMERIAQCLIDANPAESESIKEEATEASDQLGREIYNHALKIHDDGENRLGALALMNEVFQLAPQNTTMRNGYGVLLLMAGRFAEARVQFEEAIKIDPTNAEAFGNLGLLAINEIRSDAAIEPLKTCVSLDPYFVSGWLHLATAQQDCGFLTEAVETMKHLLKIAPDLSAAWNNLSIIYQDMGRFKEQVECAQKVHELDPNSHGKHSSLLFGLQYLPDGTVEELAEELHRWGEKHAAPHYHKAKPFHIPPHQENKKLKIGWLGADFKGHSSTYFMAPIFNNIDRSQFEMHIYAEVPSQDYWTNYFSERSDSFKLVHIYSDDRLAEMIRADGIDILVDLSAHTAGSRVLVLAQRPAPVQVSWIGIGNSTGVKTIDYFLTDPYYVPEGFEHLFVEKPWRLPRNLYCYDHLNAMPDPDPKPLADRAPAFGCFSRLVRINERVIDVWADLMAETPGSTLLLNTKSFRDPNLVAEYQRHFEDRGVSRDRLTFKFITPTWNSWCAYNDIDVALDPFPHNAGLTTYEALWMGCPVVTMVDRPPQGRYGESILRHFGADDWVAETPEQYVAIAKGLVSDSDRLLTLRLGLRERMRVSSLCDGAAYARDLEAAFRGMWREKSAVYAASPASAS